MAKHRKWDDPTPRSKEKCLEAAKEAADKLNMRLLKEGKISPADQLNGPPLVGINKDEPLNKLSDIMLPPPPPPSPMMSTPTTSYDNQLITCEIDINDITYACRNLLTKSVTQDDILKASGAKIATRGRYMSQEEKLSASGEKPLHLSIQGPNQKNVNVAVQRISSIIHSMCGIPLTSLSITSCTTNVKSLISSASLAYNSNTNPLAFVQDKLFVGLEHAPPSFDVKIRILGKGGLYLQHIQLETGAKVVLKGRGSGFMEPNSGREAFEPMFIYLQHGNLPGLQQAKQLAQHLLETVQKDYATFQQVLALAPPSVNPGTASMLAGLQQPAFLLNNSAWNSSMQGQGGYNTGYSYLNPVAPLPIGSIPSFPVDLGLAAGQATVGSQVIHQSYNGSVKPSMMQIPVILPGFGDLPLHPVMPPPPPPPPCTTTSTQISSVSAALSYYDNYVSMPPDGCTSAIATHQWNGSGGQLQKKRRRFQENPEEVAEQDNGNDQEDRSTQVHGMASSSSRIDYSEEDKLSSTINPAKDADGFLLPPPVVNLKRRKPESDNPSVTDQSSSDMSSQPKRLQGALISVAACYGSGSEDEEEDD